MAVCVSVAVESRAGGVGAFIIAAAPHTPPPHTHTHFSPIPHPACVWCLCAPPGKKFGTPHKTANAGLDPCMGFFSRCCHRLLVQARSEPFEVRGPSLLASPMPASMTLATFSHEAARATAAVSPPRIVVEFHTCPLHTKFDWVGISRPGELPNQGVTSGCVNVFFVGVFFAVLGAACLWLGTTSCPCLCGCPLLLLLFTLRVLFLCPVSL